MPRYFSLSPRMKSSLSCNLLLDSSSYCWLKLTSSPFRTIWFSCLLSCKILFCFYNYSLYFTLSCSSFSSWATLRSSSAFSYFRALFSLRIASLAALTRTLNCTGPFSLDCASRSLQLKSISIYCFICSISWSLSLIIATSSWKSCISV